MFYDQDLLDQGFLAFAQARGPGPLFYEPDAKKRSRPQAVVLLKGLQEWYRDLGLKGVRKW
jgi:hypothetical protein